MTDLFGGGDSSGVRSRKKPLAALPPNKKNKYGAVRTELDGIKFASKAEAKRYAFLKLRMRAKEITGLECHPAYDLTVNGHKIGVYTADFRYVENGETIVEDVKGGPTATTDYKLRAKLLFALTGIKVREITR